MAGTSQLAGLRAGSLLSRQHLGCSLNDDRKPTTRTAGEDAVVQAEGSACAKAQRRNEPGVEMERRLACQRPGSEVESEVGGWG